MQNGVSRECCLDGEGEVASLHPPGSVPGYVLLLHCILIIAHAHHQRPEKPVWSNIHACLVFADVSKYWFSTSSSQLIEFLWSST